MNVAVVVNPAARSGAHTGSATRAVDRLRRHGHRVTVISGGSARESSELIAAALRSGIDALVVVGGDGTVNLAVQHLAGSGIPLGIVPSGTGNDFAAALGIPQLEPERAADVIDAGALRTLDLARVDSGDAGPRYFVTVLASGFDSRVNDRANRMRFPRGDARYRIAILLEFLRLAPIPYRVSVDDVDLVGAFVMASVGSTRTYGGGIPICPDADPADGLLDVTVVAAVGRMRLLRLLPTVYRGTHVRRPEVKTLRGRRVRLEAEGITAYADGDPVGRLPVVIEAVPAALTVFAPVV